MKIKKLLSFAAAAAMAVTSLTSAMTFTASAADISGTLKIYAENNTSFYPSAPQSVDVAINGTGEYTATLQFSERNRNLAEMGFFTFSPYPDGGVDFTINVNSITISDAQTGYSHTYTDIPHSQGLIPAAQYISEASERGPMDAALPRCGCGSADGAITLVGDENDYISFVSSTSAARPYTVTDGTATRVYLDTIVYNFTVTKMATGDFTALDEAIGKGEALDSSLYKADSYKAVTDAITAAKAVKSNGDSTQDDIDAAAKAITDAIDALVVKDIITAYTGSGSDIKSGTVEYTGKGDYSVTVIADTPNGYLTSNLGGFALSPYPENGPDFQIDVNSIVITNDKIGGTDYTLIPTEGNTRIIPSADTVRDDTNGLVNTFVKDTVFAKSEDGNAVLIADYDGRATFKVYNTPAGLYSITYNFTAKDIEPEDNTEILNTLKETIEKAEALDASRYSADSYAALTKALENAKAITETSTSVQIKAAQKALDEALAGLVIEQEVIPAGGPIAYVYKKQTEAKITSFTVDESLAGAVKVIVTLDCASDVSFNENASIEIDPIINGTTNRVKFQGTGDYTTGTTGWTVELTLKEPLKAGDTVQLNAYTSAWDGAADYVYAITKAEFAEEDGYILKAFTDKTIAQDKLAESITNAEAINSEYVTKETYEVLSKALESAKALTDEATAEEINTVVEALETAINGLEYLPADYTKVDEAIAKIPTDLSKYTDASVKALNDAVNAVDRNKKITEQETVDGYAKAINDAVSALKVKPAPTEPDPTKPDPSKPNPTNPTTKTPAKTTVGTKATRSKEAVKKDKTAAKKAMKQAKITKLKVKSKAKKKINVTWKKVKKAKGYQVQVSTNKKFKKSKIIFKKDLKKTKLNIKNKKIKSKKTYYVRVRAYATYKDTNNKTVKVYSKWNKKLRKVKVK